MAPVIYVISVSAVVLGQTKEYYLHEHKGSYWFEPSWMSAYTKFDADSIPIVKFFADTIIEDKSPVIKTGLIDMAKKIFEFYDKTRKFELKFAVKKIHESEILGKTIAVPAEPSLDDMISRITDANLHPEDIKFHKED